MGEWAVRAEGKFQKPRTRALFARLLPAAVATAAFAGIAHAVMVAIAARSVGLELVYIAGLSFFVAFVVAAAGGTVLLVITGLLRLGLVASLILFLLSIQAVSIWLEYYLTDFQNGWSDVSWEYGLITVPASLIAWHQSVFSVHNRV